MTLGVPILFKQSLTTKSRILDFSVPTMSEEKSGVKLKVNMSNRGSTAARSKYKIKFLNFKICIT